MSNNKSVTGMTDSELAALNIRKAREICAMRLQGADIPKQDFNDAVRVWHQENTTIRNERAKDMMEIQLGHILATDEDELKQLMKVAMPNLNVVKMIESSSEQK